ncbi:MAG TPA: hypothetical protein VHQ47_08800 [Phycisphaerae bacterium]|nr:hypothetical protein [Phycisphaerae bacterium]
MPSHKRIPTSGRFHRRAIPHDTNTHGITARQVYQSLGYQDWRNFDALVMRVSQLIRHGQCCGSISKTTSIVAIGSGAVRAVPDYVLDQDAVSAITFAASSFKANVHLVRRNETVILSLLGKWCHGRGLSFVHQYRTGGFIYDAFVGGRVLVEFDEPHHATRRQSQTDAKKDAAAFAANLAITRFTLEHDIIDVIRGIELAMEK